MDSASCGGATGAAGGCVGDDCGGAGRRMAGVAVVPGPAAGGVLTADFGDALAGDFAAGAGCFAGLWGFGAGFAARGLAGFRSPAPTGGVLVAGRLAAGAFAAGAFVAVRDAVTRGVAFRLVTALPGVRRAVVFAADLPAGRTGRAAFAVLAALAERTGLAAGRAADFAILRAGALVTGRFAALAAGRLAEADGRTAGRGEALAFAAGRRAGLPAAFGCAGTRFSAGRAAGLAAGHAVVADFAAGLALEADFAPGLGFAAVPALGLPAGLAAAFAGAALPEGCARPLGAAVAVRDRRCCKALDSKALALALLTFAVVLTFGIQAILLSSGRSAPLAPVETTTSPSLSARYGNLLAPR